MASANIRTMGQQETAVAYATRRVRRYHQNLPVLLNQKLLLNRKLLLLVGATSGCVERRLTVEGTVPTHAWCVEDLWMQMEIRLMHMAFFGAMAIASTTTNQDRSAESA